jgi:hypothetical protein
MAYNLWMYGQAILTILRKASLGYSMLFKFVNFLSSFDSSVNRISTFLEHRRSRCVPFRALHHRYLRTPSSYFLWRMYHVYRHYHSDRFSVCWNVYRGSVRSRNTLSLHLALSPTCHLFSFLIGFGVTFAGNCHSLQVNRLTESHTLANAAPLLVTELAYPTQRSPLTSAYNSLWYSGAIM